MAMVTMTVKSVVLVSVTTVAALLLLNVSLVRSQHMFRSLRGKHGYSNKKMLVSPGNDPQYAWLCPRVTCPKLTEGCKHVEVIVYRYSLFKRKAGSQSRGKEISISCDSCPFCLDLPAKMIVKRSFHADHHQQLQTNTSSTESQPTCPTKCFKVPRHCQRVQRADVIVGGRVCRRCPACFDDVVGYS